MGRYLICEKQSKGGPNACKLCAMRTVRFVSWGEYTFCCLKCRGHFKDIYGNSTEMERKELHTVNSVI